MINELVFGKIFIERSVRFLTISFLMTFLTKSHCYAELSTTEPYVSSRALASIKETFSNENGRESVSKQLSVSVQLLGQSAKDAYRFISYEITDLEVNGVMLIVRKEPNVSRKEGYEMIKRGRLTSNHPRNGIGFTINTEGRPPKATKIDQLKGYAKVLTGGNLKVISIKHLLDHPEGWISDPFLKQAGIRAKFIREDTGSSDSSNLSAGVIINADTISFQGLRLVDRKGKPLRTNSMSENVGLQIGFSSNCMLHKLDTSTSILRDAVLQIQFRDGAKETNLPFHLKNIPIR